MLDWHLTNHGYMIYVLYIYTLKKITNMYYQKKWKDTNWPHKICMFTPVKVNAVMGSDYIIEPQHWSRTVGNWQKHNINIEYYRIGYIYIHMYVEIKEHMESIHALE
jgi:hypothetical protein